MKIRKFVIISIFIFFIIIVLMLFLFKHHYDIIINNNSYFYKEDGIKLISKIDKKDIILLKNEDIPFSIKGIRLTSFYPGYETKKTEISKKQVLNWLRLIKDLNANAIIVPYIQPTGFYKALYEYNLQNDDSIYVIHEISPDLNESYKTYDIYDKKIINEILNNIKDTIDVVHGNKILLNNKKTHTGIYFRDISNFNLGYIIGPNFSSELISLTNLKNDITSYEGKNYSIENSDSFNSFITMIFDKASIYEEQKYQTRSLLSWVISAETDSFSRKNENQTSNYAKIDLSKIKSKYNTIFVSVLAQPNDPDFLYMNNSKDNIYFKFLKEYTTYYNLPVVISEVGISSARGKSKVNLSDNYDRGNFNEQEQGTLLVEILKYAKQANITGVFVDSFQDVWNRVTAHNLKNVIDKDSSIYWYDAQSSDQSFGLMTFPYGKNKSVCYVDGDDNEWKNINYLLKDNVKFKVNSDSSYLYLLLDVENYDILNDKVYIGIDINSHLGSKFYEEENIEFKIPVDFVLEIEGEDNTSLNVQERYDIFSYQYKYYENIIDKQDIIPKIDSDIFNSIYMLNRKTLYDKTTGGITSVIYYDTGNFIYGNSNPSSINYNSLGDFYSNSDIIELRIPWTILNMKNPFDKIIQGDFYKNGLMDEEKIKSIEFSIVKDSYSSKIVSYNIPKYNVKNYHERLKMSYYSLQEYWAIN